MKEKIFDSLWVEKFRPDNISDVVLSDTNFNYFKDCIEKKDIPHLLFHGGPGTGKTTLAKVLAKELGVTYRYINASDERGIDTLRDKIIPFAQTKSIDNGIKIMILDEADSLTGDAQRALRNTMEEYSDNLRFIMTANYISKIIDPLKSRVTSFELLADIKRITARVCHILTYEKIYVPNEQKPMLVATIKANYPDMRRMINALQRGVRDGVLSIEEVKTTSHFADDVLDMLVKKKDASDIRKHIIDNELKFGADYRELLSNLFESIYRADIEQTKKAPALIIIGEALYRHQLVMDPEINAYCCILQLICVI